VLEKTSKRGKVFYGCSRYPDCSFATWDKRFPGSPGCGAQFLVSAPPRSRAPCHACLNPLRIKSGRVITRTGLALIIAKNALTSLITAVSLQKNMGSRMIQPFAIINLLALLTLSSPESSSGDDDKGL